MLLASFLFTIMAVCVKVATASASAAQAIFFRSAVGVPFLFWFTKTNSIRMIQGRQKRLLVLRGVMGFIALCCYFFSITKIPLGNANMLNATAPIFVVLFSARLLKERVGRTVYVLLPFFVLGVVLICRPTLSTDLLPNFVALTGGVFSAFAYMTVRRLTQNEPVTVVVFYFAVVAMVGSIPWAIYDWQPLTTKTFLLLCSSGACANLAQMAMTRAYQVEKASVVSLYGYLGPIFSYISGVLLFDEIPSPTALFGSALIVLCAVWIYRVNLQPSS